VDNLFQKKIKKLKVVTVAEEISEAMVKKLCFAGPIPTRTLNLPSSSAEETKSARS